MIASNMGHQDKALPILGASLGLVGLIGALVCLPHAAYTVFTDKLLDTGVLWDATGRKGSTQDLLPRHAPYF